MAAVKTRTPQLEIGVEVWGGLSSMIDYSVVQARERQEDLQ